MGIAFRMRWQRPPGCRCFSRGRIFQKRTCRQHWPIFEQERNLTPFPASSKFFAEETGLDALAEESPPASCPRCELPNVLITPHVGGGGGREQWRRMSELICGHSAAIFPASPSSMSSELPTARCEVFENALFAIC
jgi:hypothetical protein